ncbi:MAG: hypothetical protein R3B96_25415, partial [Pirellulaceae bacterium]
MSGSNIQVLDLIGATWSPCRVDPRPKGKAFIRTLGFAAMGFAATSNRGDRMSCSVTFACSRILFRGQRIRVA